MVLNACVYQAKIVVSSASKRGLVANARTLSLAMETMKTPQRSRFFQDILSLLLITAPRDTDHILKSVASEVKVTENIFRKPGMRSPCFCETPIPTATPGLENLRLPTHQL